MKRKKKPLTDWQARAGRLEAMLGGTVNARVSRVQEAATRYAHTSCPTCGAASGFACRTPKFHVTAIHRSRTAKATTERREVWCGAAALRGETP